VPRKLRQLRADLRALGFVLVRQAGSHQTWQHPVGLKITLAGGDGADAQRYQERDLRDARTAIEQGESEESGQ
jgi:predicted RNA binding protein YcfA (HicA-like mRNA interferase family)